MLNLFKYHSKPTSLENYTEALYNSPELAYDEANTIGLRMPELEPTILKDPAMSLHYAEDVIRGRWREFENKLLNDPKLLNQVIVSYCSRILRGKPWPEAEEVILTYPNTTADLIYRYSLSILRHRWPEAESIVLKDPGYSYYYAERVIKDRWPEAEPILKNTMYWKHYIKKWNINDD